MTDEKHEGEIVPPPGMPEVNPPQGGPNADPNTPDPEDLVPNRPGPAETDQVQDDPAS
jgi:hypothetical protein